MNKSESIKELATALAKAQGMMLPASKDAVNPQFKSRYATFAAIQDACREPLAANGLSYVQLTESGPDGMTLETILMHISGEWVSSKYPIKPVQNTPQGMGSALTYARKYTLSAMVGIASDDDDGEDASRRPMRMAERSERAEVLAGNEDAGAATPFYLEIVAKIRSCKTLAELMGVANQIEPRKGELDAHEYTAAKEAWKARQTFLNYSETPPGDPADAAKLRLAKR